MARRPLSLSSSGAHYVTVSLSGLSLCGTDTAPNKVCRRGVSAPAVGAEFLPLARVQALRYEQILVFHKAWIIFLSCAAGEFSHIAPHPMVYGNAMIARLEGRGIGSLVSGAITVKEIV